MCIDDILYQFAIFFMCLHATDLPAWALGHRIVIFFTENAYFDFKTEQLTYIVSIVSNGEDTCTKHAEIH